ncbi:MAG TPA: hypothetical protein VN854_01360, partial [Mycoplasmatales bacterium]|nr:hypothetical protein [Mycoplasmatales bacterium]
NLNLSRKTLIKIEETVLFLKKKSFKNFLGMEKLYHKSYKGEFFATYVDLDFIDFIIELKTNNVIINESSISVLAFRMQLLIQSICTEKNVWLLWSTGNGVFFEKFQPESELFEILAILIDIFQKKEIYSFETKKKIVEKMLSDYLKQARGFNLKGY